IDAGVAVGQGSGLGHGRAGSGARTAILMESPMESADESSALNSQRWRGRRIRATIHPVRQAIAGHKDDIQMRRIPGFVLLAGLVAGLSVLPATTAWAQSAPRTEGDRAGAQSVYDAEVPVNSQGEAERAGAFARALGVVLGKLSGDRNVTGRPGVGA